MRDRYGGESGPERALFGVGCDRSTVVKSEMSANRSTYMSINLSLLKKIRCRFLDQSTGLPVPGVIATLSAAIGDAATSAHLPVATLCSDFTGYMSFDLRPIVDLPAGQCVGLVYFGTGIQPQALRSAGIARRYRFRCGDEDGTPTSRGSSVWVSNNDGACRWDDGSR